MAENSTPHWLERLFAGVSLKDIAIVFAAMFVGSSLANGIQLRLNSWYYGLVLGGLAGALIASLSRRLIANRLSRQVQVSAIVAVILSALPIVLLGYETYGISLTVVMSTIAMSIATYTIFLPRSDKYTLHE